MNAIIQAGGRSSRMKEDKAWLNIDGQPMIERVLTTTQHVAEKLSVVIHPANPQLAQYENLARRWGAELLFDLHDHRGPLGGIETALQQCKAGESVWMLACDLPFLTTEFLRFLQQVHVTEHNELTVPLDPLERSQMLAAIYAASCSNEIKTMLADDELKAQRLQDRVKTRRVSWQEYAHLAEAKRFLININTPEDWQAYRKR